MSDLTFEIQKLKRMSYLFSFKFLNSAITHFQVFFMASLKSDKSTSNFGSNDTLHLLHLKKLNRLIEALLSF